jgi:guanylate kinase
MRVILTGKGGSGKDHLKKYLIEAGYKPSVSYTSRPIREGEAHGSDYYYVSEDEFKMMAERGDFEEYTCFNNWWYGTPKENFEDSEIFVMTPKIISQLRKEIRDTSLVVYIDIPLEVRKERLGKRNINGTHDIVERRLLADEQDFDNFSDFDIRIKSSFFSPEQVQRIISTYNGEY